MIDSLKQIWHSHNIDYRLSLCVKGYDEDGHKLTVREKRYLITGLVEDIFKLEQSTGSNPTLKGKKLLILDLGEELLSESPKMNTSSVFLLKNHLYQLANSLQDGDLEPIGFGNIQ